MSTLTQLHTAIVKISYVEERPSKGGLRRFLIGAERTDTEGDTLAETRLGFSTLDPWKASLCSQARDKGFPLHVKYRLTRYFDADLLFVEMVKPEPVHAD